MPVFSTKHDCKEFIERKAFLINCRKKHAKAEEGEYEKIQEYYVSATYDEAVLRSEYMATNITANEVKFLFPSNNDVKILDYGCGTGLVAEELTKVGFQHIDGIDLNLTSLQKAKEKGCLRSAFHMKTSGDHSELSLNAYDVVCSTGVFFLGPAFPGYHNFQELCKLVRSGGYILIVCAYAYLSNPYVDEKIIKDLEAWGVLKIFPRKVTLGYRIGQKAAILKFRVH